MSANPPHSAPNPSSHARVRLAQASDLGALLEHNRRSHAENGRDGDLIFTPFEPGENPVDRSAPEELERTVRSWSLPVSDPGWQRCWILEEGASIRGMLRLSLRVPLPTARHRALLQMGIERTHRGQGWGRKLIEAAIRWAREDAGLSWLELYVFGHNEPARALYGRMGFREIGRVEDQFRVAGQKIADLHLELKLD